MIFSIFAGNIFFIVSMNSLEEARLWSSLATETDYVMDLQSMNLLSTSIAPFLHWDCVLEPLEKPKDKGSEDKTYAKILP